MLFAIGETHDSPSVHLDYWRKLLAKLMTHVQLILTIGENISENCHSPSYVT